MKKKQLTWFVIAMCFFIGLTSCSEDDDDKDQRLVNKENKEAGEQFLIDNATQEGVKQLSTGLQYKVVSSDSEGIRPYTEDSVNVTYTGKLIDGTFFISLTAEEILLANLPLEGFKEGLQLMPAGSTYIFYIPYYLAYNASSKTFSYDGRSVVVQPYSVLIMEVTLNSVTRNSYD